MSSQRVIFFIKINSKTHHDLFYQVVIYLLTICMSQGQIIVWHTFHNAILFIYFIEIHESNSSEQMKIRKTLHLKNKHLTPKLNRRVLNSACLVLQISRVYCCISPALGSPLPCSQAKPAALLQTRTTESPALLLAFWPPCSERLTYLFYFMVFYLHNLFPLQQTFCSFISKNYILM